MSNRRSILVLVLFLISAVVVLTLSLATGFSLNSLVGSLEQSRSDRLLSEAQAASLVVSADDLAALDAPETSGNDLDTSGALQDEHLVAMQRRLNAFADLHKLTEIAYLRPLPTGELQCLISNTTETGNHTITGALVGSNEMIERALSGSIGVIDLNETEQTASVLTAYSPVFDSSGSVVAVAAVGVNDAIIIDADTNIRNLTIVLLVCVAIVILAACANVLLQVRKEHELGEGIKVQKLTIEMSQTLASERPFENRAYDVLNALGSYLGAFRAYIINISKTEAPSALCQHWTSESSQTTPMETKELTTVLGVLQSAFYSQRAEKARTLYCNDVARVHKVVKTDTASEAKEDLSHTLSQIHTAAFIWAPLFVQGRIWGVLALDFEKAQGQFSASSVQLIESTIPDLVGAITRELYSKQREQALDHAIHASEAKSEFLSNMSHEIRTPMNAIIGMTSIALSTTDTKRKDYCLEHIKEASDHLLTIINDVLDMSSIESNTILLAQAPFDVREALAETAGEYLSRMQDRSQHFSSEVDERVPTTLLGDKQRLMQIVGNLLSNAIKFTADKGTISLRVKQIGVCRKGHILHFEIEDNGIGINPALKGTLFGSFSQAESGTARRYGGAGLGLAISRRLIELMQGQMGLESEVGKGSRFFFTVTLEAGNEKKERVHRVELHEPMTRYGADSGAFEEDFAERSAGRTETPLPTGSLVGNVRLADGATDGANSEVPPDGTPDLSHYRVLLAEDIDINREVVIALLEESGIQINIATNGREAFEAVKDHPEAYHLVFMDLQMPEMDGIDATRRIRALPHPATAKLPIIAMTANVMQKDIDSCLRAGMNDHIGKPINLTDVYRTLAKYLPKK